MKTEKASLLPLVVLAGMVGAGLFIYGVILDDDWLRLVAKPVPVLAMLIGVALYGRGRYGRTIMWALGFCMLGDIFLEVGDSTFLLGVGAFMLGHVGFIAAFLRRARSLRPLEALPLVAWIGWALWRLWPSLGEMLVPGIAYTAAIFVMVWRAAALVAEQAERTHFEWMILVGAVLFGFSDTLIALDRFDAPIDGSFYAIILTYWGGQLLIALSTTSPKVELD